MNNPHLLSFHFVLVLEAIAKSLQINFRICFRKRESRVSQNSSAFPDFVYIYKLTECTKPFLGSMKLRNIFTLP